ncbi:MAG: DDE-type integrase/transposase/recombinase [Promethearchaeota archaeon]
MPRGRPRIYDKVSRTVALVLELPDGERVTWEGIQIACPDCHGTYVTCNGKPKLKSGEVQNLKCETCGRQFKFHSSAYFQEKLEALLWDVCVEVVQDGAKQGTIARKWGFSDATMSKIVSVLKTELTKNFQVVPLLDARVNTTLVSMDEAFIRIGGKNYVIIIARNNEGKTLAFSVSERRAEEDLRAVFDAAEAQMTGPTEILLSDGLNAYQGLARNLKRDIIHAIHFHKPPYGRLVVRDIKYDGNYREELTVATKTDILTRRGKREVRYTTSRRYVGPPRQRGRKKGRKNKKPRSKKKRPPARKRSGVRGTGSRPCTSAALKRTSE